MSDQDKNDANQPQNEQDMQPVAEFTKVDCIFVRHRNVLMLKANFVPIFTDHYIHLMENSIKFKDDLDQKLKDLMALLTLHLCARPWAETIAWTINLRAPRMNFFATGGSTKENIVGTLFTENVKEHARSLMYNQTIRPGEDVSQSTIEIDSSDPIEWVEKYYAKSEQRPGRAFRLQNDDYVLIAAQPDYDQEWFEALTEDDVSQILDLEQTKLLETRRFKFHCGCSKDQLARALYGYKDKPDELFGDQETITATCPRCRKTYTLDREIFDLLDKKSEE